MTIDSSTPLPHNPARVATAANPITCLSRSEQFCLAPKAGPESEMAATWPRYPLHYVNVAPLKSSTRRAKINRTAPDWRYIPICQRSVELRQTEKGFFRNVLIGDLVFVKIAPHSRNLIAAMCFTLHRENNRSRAGFGG